MTLPSGRSVWHQPNGSADLLPFRPAVRDLGRTFPPDPPHGRRAASLLIVSPWTRGGWVNSQLFDHTSMSRFLEARFAGGRADLIESNITPWRRAVLGALTSAFNFRTPNTDWKVRLPDTDDFKPVDLVRHPDQVPVRPADP